MICLKLQERVSLFQRHVKGMLNERLYLVTEASGTELDYQIVAPTF